MPANEVFREPLYVQIDEPGTKLARDISSMGLASTDGTAARAQQEKIAAARQRVKDQNQRITDIETQINSLKTETSDIKGLLTQILNRMK